jgi:hypothetical protein
MWCSARPRVFAAKPRPVELYGSNGFKLSWRAAVTERRSVASAGDVNGDGFADLIVGARCRSARLRFGRELCGVRQGLGFAANLDLSSLDGSNGFKLSGVAAGDRAAFGRLGGRRQRRRLCRPDRRRPRADPHGYDSGASYVVFGKASGFAANLDLSSLNGSNGFKLSGVAAGDGAASRSPRRATSTATALPT